MAEDNQNVEATPEDSAAEVEESIDRGLEGEEEVAEGEEEEAVDVEEATDEELEEVAESDEATEEEKLEAKVELKKRMKFKINGRDVEREIDLSDENLLHELLQKGFAADERFQSASQIEKKMKDFAALMQKDPIKALMEAGHDPDKLTENYMKKRVEELSKSPEQLQLEKLQKEIEEERQKREALEHEKLTAEQQRIEAEYSRQLDEEISEAMASSDLPKSPYVVKRIAENLMLGIQQGNEDITVQDVLPVVERQIKQEIQQMFEAMPEDIIDRVLGPNVSKKLRNGRLTKMKKTDSAASVKATGQSEMKKAAAKEAPKKPIRAKDFFGNF